MALYIRRKAMEATLTVTGEVRSVAGEYPQFPARTAAAAARAPASWMLPGGPRITIETASSNSNRATQALSPCRAQPLVDKVHLASWILCNRSRLPCTSHSMSAAEDPGASRLVSPPPSNTVPRQATSSIASLLHLSVTRVSSATVAGKQESLVL